MKSAKDRLEENGYDSSEIIVFDNPSYDDALIGVTDDGRAVYDYEAMIVWLASNENMTLEEAADIIDYDTLNARSEGYPVVIYRFHD